MSPKEYYNLLQAEAQEKKSGLSKKIMTVSVARLLLAVVAMGAIWLYWGAPKVIGVVDGICVIAFLVLVKYHDRLFRARALEEAYIRIAKDNVARMALDLKKAPTGDEFLDAEHPYSYDLDVFGKGSLFSLLDTTATRNGMDLLAMHLQNPQDVRAEIKLRQDAVKELCSMNAFRTTMRALGIVAVEDEDKGSENVDIRRLPSFALPVLARIATWVVPILWLIVIGLGIYGESVGVMVTALIMISLLAAGFGAKKVGRQHQALSDISERVMVYHELFLEIEKTDFKSEKLNSIRKAVSGEYNACKASRELLKIVRNLDQRYNWLSYFVFNVLVQWDYRQIGAAEKWAKLYGGKLAEWEDALSQIDELSALATYGYNNPNYIFPTEDKLGAIVIEGTKMGHPLLGEAQCVCNDVEPMRSGDFMVVTGANMAGKSTYLRMVGVNYLFALIGAPVFAKTMTFSPRVMCTGLRTTDSLQENKSYFFAELTRLQSIIKRADEGEKLFVILDEILKGTNSVDKQKGSIGLVRQLVNKKVTGIIATHDLKLGALAEEFPDNVDNYCFEAQLGGDTLTFDYLLQHGIAKNMNATYLMRKMGIIE